MPPTRARLLAVFAFVPCAVSSAQPRPFTDEAVERGVVFTTPVGVPDARGVAFVDLNNDSLPDLVMSGGVGNAVGVWENDGSGRFIYRSVGSGIAAFPSTSGLAAGDFDADGRLDLYLSRWAMPNVLLRNNGNFQFSNVTTAARVANGSTPTMGCAWGDVNADGWVDLYVSNFTNPVHPPPNAFYRNDGSSTFTELAGAMGIADAGYTWQSTFFDYDRDSWPDLYVSNDKGYELPPCSRHNYLFRNIKGAFVDATQESGTAACVESMGIAVGDIDGNRYPDIYITNTALGHQLYLNQGDRTFIEASQTWGVQSFSYGWGTIFFDYDNDGRLDLFVCNSDAPNRLYVHQGSKCVDLAPALGVDMPGLSKQVVAMADIEPDGDLDIVVQSVGQPARLFINHEGERRKWIKFNVRGADRNRFAFGASVDIRIGDVWQTRDVMGCGGFKSHDQTTLHFGVNKATVVDEILIRWTGGADREGGTRTLRNYPTNHTWTLYPDIMLGGADPATGQLDSEDFFAFLDCFFASDGPATPGCEIMDMDSDGRMTSGDFFEFLGRLFR